MKLIYDLMHVFENETGTLPAERRKDIEWKMRRILEEAECVVKAGPLYMFKGEIRTGDPSGVLVIDSEELEEYIQQYSME